MTRNVNEQVREYSRRRRRRARWGKLLGVMACVVVFCTVYALILPGITLEHTDDDSVMVYELPLYQDAASAETVSVSLPQDAHVQLKAQGDAGSFQWQIWSGDSWLNIYGDTGRTCDVYYAKLANMLSGNSAKLRATAGEYVSATASVTVLAFDQPTSPEPPEILEEGTPSPEGALLKAPAEEASFVPQPSVEEPSVEEPPVQEPAVPICGMEAHTHSESCMKQKLICGYEDQADQPVEDGPEMEPVPQCGMNPGDGAHTHTAECVQEQQTLTCQQGGEEAHTHTEECYTTETIYICGQEASEGHVHDESCYGTPAEPTEPHVHTDACYEEVLDCGLEAHEHTEDCYPQEQSAGISVFSMDEPTVIDDEGDGGEVDLTKYTVLVNYVRQADTGAVQIANPWRGTFAASGVTGMPKVEFPTIQGYEVTGVYLGTTPVEEDTLVRDGDKIVGLTLPETITDNMRYAVLYEAAKVPYTVKYMLQSLADPDLYELKETKTYYAKTGTLLSQDTTPYEGFRQVAYKYPTVSGDGQMVLEIKYDREFYKIIFDLNGGIGVTDLYVQYGTPLPNINDLIPTRTGYTFQRWLDANGSPVTELPATMPARNQTLYADWGEGDTNYRVGVWVENLAGDGYDFLTSAQMQGSTGSQVNYQTPDVQSYLQSLADKDNSLYEEELQYFTLDEVACKAAYGEGSTSIRVAGDGSTVVNVYYSRNSYTLRFVYGRSYSNYGTTYYQRSESNHGYSLHILPDNGGMTGYDLTTGCRWVDGGTAEFTFSSAYQKIMDENSGVFQKGTFTQSNYTYYYFDLTAKYGEDIFEYWPTSGCISLNGNSVIDWGTQYDSDYRKQYAADGSNNAEPNIHPYYRVMDKLLINTDNRQTAGNGPTHTLVAYTSNNEIFTWEYTPYYEALQSQISDDSVTKVTYNGKQYVAGTTVNVYTTQQNHSVDYVSVVANDGFITPSTDTDTLVAGERYDNGQTIYTLSLYYVRERHDLTFHNGYWGVKLVEDVPYGEDLGSYIAPTVTAQFDPQYNPDDPSTVPTPVPGESGTDVALTNITPLAATQADPDFEAKWKFGGKWYTAWDSSLKTVTGEEFILANNTMPNSNLIVYALWEPQTYMAAFFWESPDSQTAGAGELFDPQKQLPGNPAYSNVPYQTFAYGSTLQAPDPDPEYGSLEFLYWTYYVFEDNYEGTDTESQKTYKFAKDEPLFFPEGTSIETANKVTVALLNNPDVPLVERRLDFDTTEFRSDVLVYGHWNSIVNVSYDVYYVMLNPDVDNDTVVTEVKEGKAYDADGNAVGVQIADPDHSEALAGETVTLTAKTGDQLNDGYRPGQTNACYPVGSSTYGLLLDYNQKSMQHVFTYKPAQYITYKVRYVTQKLDADGNPVLDANNQPVYVEFESLTDANGTPLNIKDQDGNVVKSFTRTDPVAIVTENSLFIPGYSLTTSPETNTRDYQITRVLSYAAPNEETDDPNDTVITEANTITFYYTLNENAAMYTVEFYQQNLDGTYARNDHMTMELEGLVGSNVHAPTVTIPGYWHDLTPKDETPIEMGTVTKDGSLVLKAYYSAYPVSLTKNWGDVPENERPDSLTIWFYETEKQQNGEYQAKMTVHEATLNAAGNWSTTVYLPYLEDLDEDGNLVTQDGFYLAEEANALDKGYLATYGDKTTKLWAVYYGPDGTTESSREQITGGRIDLKKVDPDNPTAPEAVTLTVTNNLAVELPNTGGFGPGTIVITGLVLAFAAGSLLYMDHQAKLRRRRRRRPMAAAQHPSARRPVNAGQQSPAGRSMSANPQTPGRRRPR